VLPVAGGVLPLRRHASSLIGYDIRNWDEWCVPLAEPAHGLLDARVCGGAVG
jgi:hypothetical protein